MDIEWEILSKVVKEKASKQEENLYKQWYEGTSEQKRLIKDIGSFYEDFDENRHFSEENINKEWRKLVRSVKPIRRITYFAMRIAAIFVIICGLAISYLYIDKEFLSPETKIASISKGEQKAILILSNGARHDLSNNKEEVIKLGGLVIKNKNKTLTFESGVTKNRGEIENRDTKHNTIKVPRFGEYRLTLADGTKVWLNAMSSLKFPNVFNGKYRNVIVDGEAYFDVAHNPDKPFIVTCNNVRVRVLGTEFNIRSYESNKIAATLVKGKVQMNYIDKPISTVILNPGEQGIAKSGDIGIKVKKVNIGSIIAWKSGEFVFENRRLEDIMNELSMWYDINVFYENSDIQNERFYVYLNRSDDFKTVLKKFEATDKLNIRVRGKNVIISKK